MPTEQQVIAQVLALVDAAVSVAAVEPDKVPSPRPAEFVTVTIVRRSGGLPRAGRYVTAGWSVYVMAASQSSAKNARVSLEEARSALESVVLTVGGVQSTPVRFDNARPVGPDDGWFSGVNVYSFTL